MRLLTTMALLLFSLCAYAQPCTSGEGKLTVKEVLPALCLDYRTFLLLRDGTPYTVAISASRDSIEVVYFSEGSKPDRETWLRTEETTQFAVFLYNNTIDLIYKQEY